ncbi:hypothetical protein QTP88_028531 [Uroleucon formosanum]
MCLERVFKLVVAKDGFDMTERRQIPEYPAGVVGVAGDNPVAGYRLYGAGTYESSHSTITQTTVVTANNIQKNPEIATNNDAFLISTFRQNLEQDNEIPDNNYTNCTDSYTDLNKIVDSSEILKSQLANWVVQCNVPNITFNRLLPILKQHECFNSLPLDCRTL